MAEVLRSVDDPITDEVGMYHVRVVGRCCDEDGMWEGWLEFDRLDGSGETLVGPVESKQPEREHLEYWAGGLSPVFIEGALHRARSPLIVRTRIREEPKSSAPAPRMVRMPQRDLRPEAVLDPFDVSGGLDILEQKLRALNRPRLLDIIGAYSLNGTNEDLSWLTESQLVRFIVVAVETQQMRRARS